MNMIDDTEEMNRWFEEIRMVVDFFFDIFQEEKVPSLPLNREI